MDGITEESLVENEYGFQELFKRFDKNNDGKVTREECQEILQSIFGELPKKTILKMVNYADFNSDGTIDYHEFSDIMRQRIQIKDSFLKEFQMIDKNGDGKLSHLELKEVITKLGTAHKSDAEINQIIQNVDEDGDGYLDYNEFLKLIMK